MCQDLKKWQTGGEEANRDLGPHRLSTGLQNNNNNNNKMFEGWKIPFEYQTHTEPVIKELENGVSII